MIAVDTNILVYAHRPETQFSQQAFELVRSMAEGKDLWGLPVHCLIEFVAVVSNQRIFKNPSSPSQIRKQIDVWFESESAVAITESRESLETLFQMRDKNPISGGQVHDARIVACCIAAGVQTLYSVDRDFSRYSGLQIQKPFLR